MKQIFYKKEISLLVGIVFFGSFLFLYNIIPIDVNAQQLKKGMTISDTNKNTSEAQNSNWTGSVEISKVLRESFNPLIKISLSDAINNSELEIGHNSSAVAAFIHPVKGYLVYVIYLLDDQNEVTKVITDVGTGNILNVTTMTIEEMMLTFHNGGMTKSTNQSFGKDKMMDAMMLNANVTP
jgi:hypothetical protein